MGTERFTPAAVWADAVNAKVAPSWTERLLAGVKLTKAGKSGGPAFAALPQPVMLHKERIATARGKTFERNLPTHKDLPMHPLSNIALAVRSEQSRTSHSNELENL
jgi:hypothetical protein